MKNLRFVFLILLFNLIFYFPIFGGKTPLPADNLLAYYPWRFYAEGQKAKNPAYFDVMMIMYPWKKLAVETIKSGSFPLINKYFGLSYPYFAAVQSGILYPTTILFLMLPFEAAWSIHIFLQTFLAGIFMYFLLRRYKLSDWSSFFGAIVFSFSGHFMVWLEYGTLVNAACWLPLVILLIEMLFEQRKVWISSLMSLVLAFSFFAGFPQTSFYVLIFSAAYFLYRMRRAGVVGLPATPVPLSGTWRAGVLGLLGFLGLIAIQLLPFLDYLSSTTRSFIDPLKYFSWSILPTSLINFVFPDFFGNPAQNLFWGRGNYQEFTVYLGVIPFLLAVWSVFKGKIPKFWRWSLILILVFLIYNPFLYLFYKLNLPLLSKMSHSRLIVLLTFVLVIISSFGFEQVFKASKKRSKDFIKIFGGILAFLGFDLWFYYLKISQLHFNYKWREVLPVILSSLVNPFLFTAGFFLIFFIFQKKIIKVNLVKPMVIFLCLIDLFIFGRIYNPFIDTKQVFKPTKLVDFLQNDESDFRIISENPVFPGNLGTIYHLSFLNSVDTLTPLAFQKFSQEALKVNYDPSQLATLDNYSHIDQKVLDMAQVKYVLTDKIVTLPEHKLVFSAEGVNVYLRNSFKSEKLKELAFSSSSFEKGLSISLMSLLLIFLFICYTGVKLIIK